METQSTKLSDDHTKALALCARALTSVTPLFTAALAKADVPERMVFETESVLVAVCTAITTYRDRDGSLCDPYSTAAREAGAKLIEVSAALRVIGQGAVTDYKARYPLGAMLRQSLHMPMEPGDKHTDPKARMADLLRVGFVQNRAQLLDTAVDVVAHMVDDVSEVVKFMEGLGGTKPAERAREKLDCITRTVPLLGALLAEAMAEPPAPAPAAEPTDPTAPLDPPAEPSAH